MKANTPTQAESLFHSLKLAAGVNVDKMKYMCFNQKGDISTLNGGSLKSRNKFTYCYITRYGYVEYSYI